MLLGKGKRGIIKDDVVRDNDMVQKNTEGVKRGKLVRSDGEKVRITLATEDTKVRIG